jgi:hypothetical protein
LYQLTGDDHPSGWKVTTEFLTREEDSIDWWLENKCIGYFETKEDKDGAFTYQVDSSGFWSVDNVEYYPNTATDMDTAKAAIHEWRVNHLKSMLP